MERPSLLLVDPDPRSTRVLEVALRKAGYAVKVTSTGAEALAEATRALPALLLAETVLPAVDGEAALDGFELCRRVQALAGGGGVPFIFLTSSSAVEDKVRGLQLGVEDYLTKPIYIKELLTRVQLVFSRLQRSGLQSSTARHGFTGELADMGLVDLLTTLDLGRKSGTLALSGPFGKAQARFRDGRVLDARAGSLRGERALYRMLGWTEGRFEVHFGAVDEGEVTLDASTQVLLLEGVRRLDEWQHLQESLPPLTLPFDPVPRQSQEVPMEADPILRHLDGTRSALEALEASGLGDLEALTIFSRLYHQGLVQARRLSLGLGDSLPEILSGPTEPEGLSPTELQVPSDQPPPPEEELERVLDGMTAAFRSNHKTVEASQEGAGSPHPTPPTPLGSDPESTGPAQEQDVAKHRGKRGKSKRESMAPGVATASNAAIETEEPVAQTDPPTSMVAPRTEALSAPPDKTVRVEGNVIHFPKLTPEPAEAPPRVGQVTLPAGSMAPEEPGRDSSPPAEPGPHASTAPPGSTPSEPAPAFSEPEAA
ncbi:MAG: DUF4388 domain-containing protein [Deltaproteobacteria bacterium]|nr:DUF4388 domain-containing protein [Deltaproteobacteria bacterium]